MNSASTALVHRVQILLFDGVEVLDFAGPFEVFAVTGELNDGKYFNVSTVATERRVYTAVNGLQVVPAQTIAEAPAPDIVVVPGGAGTKVVMNDARLLAWLVKVHATSEITMSVCSGARLLAKIGILDGIEATTHHGVFDDLAAMAPLARLNRTARFVDTGRILTTRGISAGIDGSFHVVERLAGTEVAKRTAVYMEYVWSGSSGT